MSRELERWKASIRLPVLNVTLTIVPTAWPSVLPIFLGYLLMRE
jgi:hypothetical protein